VKPRFQIRLRTALVLMIAAAVLLWLNFRATCEPRHKSTSPFTIDWEQDYYFIDWQRGWPFTMNWGTKGAKSIVFSRYDRENFPAFGAYRTRPEPPTGLEGKWEVRAIFVNFCVAFLALSTIYLLFTVLDRREEARKR
jgi:hypothetical protein